MWLPCSSGPPGLIERALESLQSDDAPIPQPGTLPDLQVPYAEVLAPITTENPGCRGGVAYQMSLWSWPVLLMPNTCSMQECLRLLSCCILLVARALSFWQIYRWLQWVSRMMQALVPFLELWFAV